MRALALACLASAVPAAAGTICVDPAGPPCHTTIQAGVNAAQPGSTVSIAQGIYFENVTVPPGRDGLRLVGASRMTTVIDADAPNTGSGLRIESSGVGVTSIGFRNGQQYGVVVAGGAHRVRLEDLRFIGVRGPAAVLAEQGASGLRVASNVIRAAGRSAGIVLEGNDGAFVGANQVEQVESGIRARGSRLVVEANHVSAIADTGIWIEGADALVAGNEIERVFKFGIAVTGSNPVVRDNRLANAGGIAVACTRCSGGEVRSNRNLPATGFTFSLGSGHGVDVTADAPGLVVQENEVSAAAAAAFRIGGTGVRAVGNLAQDTGAGPGLGYGFLVHGSGPHTLEKNRAINTSGAGFVIAGDEATLDSNLSQDAGGSGFLLLDPNPNNVNERNVLRNNEARGSNLAGFAVSPASKETTLVGNRGEGNRYDFCDDGKGTVATGNQFGSTSTTCDVLE